LEDLRIANIQNIVEAAVQAVRFFDSGAPWWRGQSLSSWELRPSIYRVEDGAYQYERNIASRFISKAPTRHPNCPSQTDLPGWFFLMQHYGLPTRILDWTNSVLVATYFAVFDEEKHHEDGALWSLRGAYLNDEQFGKRTIASVADPTAVTLFREALSGAAGEPSTVTAAINAQHIDTRMMIQLAEFTIHGTADPVETLPNHEKFLMKFIVPKTAKASLKQVLSLFGISQASLFPDLEHLATELRESRFTE